MTLKEYRKVKNRKKNIYFPVGKQGQWPGSPDYVKAQGTVVIDDVLFHQDTAGPAYAIVNLEDCEEWDIRHLKCPNCGSKVDYEGITGQGTKKVRGYCPTCCSEGPEKPTEREAREAFYRYGQVQTFYWKPSSNLMCYEINQCSDGQYEVLIKYWWGEDAMENTFKTPDEARQVCKAHYDDRMHKKGYIEVSEDCVVVKKENLCIKCRHSLLNEASSLDVAESYQETESGPFFHETNK